MPGMRATMDEWKAGTLRSGSKAGPVVKNQKQAVAIALSEERQAGKKVKATAKAPRMSADEREYQSLRKAALGSRA